jgi:uncharacterized protein
MLNKFVAFSLALTGTAYAVEDIKFSHEKLEIGAQVLNIEVARTNEQLEHGLMFRHALAEDAGMLFVYHRPIELSFWMKNTFIPLSIGYFDANKELIDIQDMAPMKSEMQTDTPSYRSRGLAQYALEVNQGWFQRHNVGLHARFAELPNPR